MELVGVANLAATTETMVTVEGHRVTDMSKEDCPLVMITVAEGLRLVVTGSTESMAVRDMTLQVVGILAERETVAMMEVVEGRWSQLLQRNWRKLDFQTSEMVSAQTLSFSCARTHTQNAAK